MRCYAAFALLVCTAKRRSPASTPSTSRTRRTRGRARSRGGPQAAQRRRRCPSHAECWSCRHLTRSPCLLGAARESRVLRQQLLSAQCRQLDSPPTAVTVPTLTIEARLARHSECCGFGLRETNGEMECQTAVAIRVWMLTGEKLPQSWNRVSMRNARRH